MNIIFYFISFILGFLFGKKYIDQRFKGIIKTRTIAGIQIAKAKGIHVGRPKGRKDSKKRKTDGYFERHRKNIKERERKRKLKQKKKALDKSKESLNIYG